MPAGMPEPRAMDGNFLTFKVFNRSWGILQLHIHVTGYRHPCRHDDFPAMLQILTTHLSRDSFKRVTGNAKPLLGEHPQ